MLKTISVINFKGGVGKTTLAFHLATHLASTNKRVLLMDVDHQSSASIVTLGGKLWGNLVTNGLTTNKIFESFCNRKVTFPGEEILFKNPIGTRSPKYNYYPSLDIVPAQFELDDTEIELASTTMGGPTVSEWEKRTLVASWLDKVNAQQNYDYVIFDCPPATKLVSQNAIAASQSYIVPVIPDELSSRGVTHFTNLITNKIDKKLEYLRQGAGVSLTDAPANYVAATRLAAIVPYMPKVAGNAASGLTDVSTNQVAKLNKTWGTSVTQTNVKHLIGVPRAMSMGWPVWNLTGTQNISASLIKSMRTLCQEIEAKL